MSLTSTTTIYACPAANVRLGGVAVGVSFGQAKDLETIESGWAMSGRRPTPHTETAA